MPLFSNSNLEIGFILLQQSFPLPQFYKTFIRSRTWFNRYSPMPLSPSIFGHVSSAGTLVWDDIFCRAYRHTHARTHTHTVANQPLFQAPAPNERNLADSQRNFRPALCLPPPLNCSEVGQDLFKFWSNRSRGNKHI